MWFRVFLFLLLSSSAWAGLPPTRILDEGVDKGVAFKFDCVGAGIACTQSGITGTLTVGTGAGGDSVSIDGVAVTDPNFNSTGDVDFVDTANVVTGTVVSVRPAAENSIEALLDLQDLQGAVTDGQVPNTITIDNSATATALAADPADCAANTFATTIAASGALTCASIADADVPNTITIDLATLATTATTANAGDSATSFFSSGTLEVAIGGTGTTTSTGTGAVVLGTAPSISSPTFTTAITATNLITDAHLATTESINLPVYSAKLTGAFVVFTPPTADACTQGAQIDAGDGNWRLLFDATTDECATFQFVLPDYWAAHSELKILYSMSSATANEVDFEAAVMCVTPTDAADVGTAGFANVATASDTVPGTAGYLDSVSITITDDSCAAGDLMFVVISKDANDATLDDATGDTEVVGVVYEFNR